jgi:hypothetical protein
MCASQSIGCGSIAFAEERAHAKARRIVSIIAYSFMVPVTSSWSNRLPNGYARIGISRGPPRNQRGFRIYRPLVPGAWFRSVGEADFPERYMEQLKGLDAGVVLRDLAPCWQQDARVAVLRATPSGSRLVSSRPCVCLVLRAVGTTSLRIWSCVRRLGVDASQATIRHAHHG